MGQLSSSEVQQAATAVAASKAVITTTKTASATLRSPVAENNGDQQQHQQQRAASNLAATMPLAIRPSQPIDIRVGQGGRIRPLPEPAAIPKCRQQIKLSEEATKTVTAATAEVWRKQLLPLHHQPRVIKPKRLSGSPSASLGPTRAAGNAHFGGRNDLSGYRERVWQEAMRRRLLSLDSRIIAINNNIGIDPECPSSSGENNKENQKQPMGTTMLMTGIIDEGSKKLSRSRKRLNSIELKYDNCDVDGTTGGKDDKQKEQKHEKSTINEQMMCIPDDGFLHENNDTSNLIGQQQQPQHKPSTEFEQQQDTNGIGHRMVGAGRRTTASGGRIAYLYGVYGQERPQPYSVQPHQLLFVHQQQQQQQRPSFFSANHQSQMNIQAASNPWRSYYCDEQQQQRQYQMPMCCTTGYEEDYLEMDRQEEEEADLLMLDQDESIERLARFHTVSDIIGYAKVVRAQRQETLGRLNDVMSQFDALIRSYSLTMKYSNNNNESNHEDQTNTTTMIASTELTEDNSNSRTTMISSPQQEQQQNMLIN